MERGERMIIRRNVTFEELKTMHQETAERVEEALSALEVELDAMQNIKWRGSLSSRDTLSEISVTAHNIMLWALELSTAQADLDRINKKRMKIVKGGR